MDKKYGILIICAAILFSCFVGTASAKTWYVDDDGGANFTRIQDAITAARDGDTIIVRDGNYLGNVNAKKSLTIQSENGSTNCIVQAENSYDCVFKVTAGYVNISGFTVEGKDRAISLDNVDYCNITNNNCSTDKYAGIELRSSNNNTIANNTASNSQSRHGIILDHSNNNILRNNTVSNNGGDGILLWDSNNNILTHNNISNNDGCGIALVSYSNNNVLINNMFVNNGIEVRYSYQNSVEKNIVNGRLLVYLEDESDLTIADAGQVILVNCNNITVENLNLSNASVGVELWNTDNSKIVNNTANWNVHGIYMDYYSNNNILTSNNISNSDWGIVLSDSNNNILMSNNISNNDYWGILMSGSNNNILLNNMFVNGGVWVYSSYQNTVEENTVNGKPLVYLEDESDFTISDAGQVILVNCNNITVENLDLSNASVGVELWNTDNSKIVNNTANWNVHGIYLGYYSNNNVLCNNTISNNGDDGISLWDSNSNSISNNTCSNNEYNGIYLYKSSNNSISYNNCPSNNWYGIYLNDYSNNNILTSNTVSNNHAGTSLLFSSNNNTLMNNMASNNEYGIYLSQSSNNTLTNNTASNNNYGIYLWSWNYYNTFTNNTASNNNYGIALHHSSDNNIIYLNNFIDNTYNVYSYKSTNIWNSTSKITYTYKGTTYENYLGNYRDDYKEKYPDAEEVDGTGIWDTPYSINSDADNYPLVGPWEKYFAPTENIFDTSTPANPYPSIFGTHKGTITPNVTIEVSKLHTYPCAGTGGHTEYARIWNNNSSLDANASWKGYVGDWYNISFSEPFTLVANEIYNYTIQTGSYPQIHHTSALLTASGWINCTEFVDANGKKYYNWIPAIRLE